jgi:hypothetical protein
MGGMSCNARKSPIASAVDREQKRTEDFIRRQAVVLQREFDSDVAHEVCVRLADAIEAGRHRR